MIEDWPSQTLVRWKHTGQTSYHRYWSGESTLARLAITDTGHVKAHWPGWLSQILVRWKHTGQTNHHRYWLVSKTQHYMATSWLLAKCCTSHPKLAKQRLLLINVWNNFSFTIWCVDEYNVTVACIIVPSAGRIEECLIKPISWCRNAGHWSIYWSIKT